MASLREFLHKLVDKVGDQSLHEDVDNLDEKAPETEGEEATTDAAE